MTPPGSVTGRRAGSDGRSLIALPLFVVAAVLAVLVPVSSGVVRGIVIGVLVVCCIAGGALLALALVPARAGAAERDAFGAWLPSRDGAEPLGAAHAGRDEVDHR